MKILYYLIIVLCLASALLFSLTTEVNVKDDPSEAIVICLRSVNCPNTTLNHFSDEYIYLITPDESYLMRDLYLLNHRYGFISLLLLLVLFIKKIITYASGERANNE